MFRKVESSNYLYETIFLFPSLPPLFFFFFFFVGCRDTCLRTYRVAQIYEFCKKKRKLF